MKTKHPGDTAAQRRILDEIGCGNNSPRMADSTRVALLGAGLIVELEPKLICGPGNSPIDRIPLKIRQFEMPIPVHMQWCEAVSEEPE